MKKKVGRPSKKKEIVENEIYSDDQILESMFSHLKKFEKKYTNDVFVRDKINAASRCLEGAFNYMRMTNK